MITRFSRLPAVLLLAVLFAMGCKKGVEADVAPLEKAFPQAATASPEQKAVSDLVADAMTAARANDYPKAAASLTVLRNQPVLTSDQRAAIQDAMGNIQMELARRAEAGDAAAAAALGEVRRMQSR